MYLFSRPAILIDEVARSGSIRAAAERLNTSPSAVNRHILGLEEQYGLPLFERLPRGMRLTAAGEILVDRVRKWRREEEAADIRIGALKGLDRTHARVGVIDTVAEELMPRVFRRLHAEDPHATLDVVVGGTEMLSSELQEGNLDLAVCFNLQPHRDLTVEASVPSRSGILVRTGHPLAARSGVRLSDLVDYPLILPASPFMLRQTLDEGFARLSITPHTIVSTNSTAVMKSMLAQGEHVAIIGALAACKELEQGALAFRPLLHGEIHSTALMLAIQSHLFPTAARRRIVGIFREILEEMALQRSPDPAPAS